MVAEFDHWSVEGHVWEFRRVQVATLKFEQYNRPIKLNWVKQIHKTFDAALCEPLTVNERTDGTLVCIDGQHRAKALVMTFGPAVAWPCVVHRGLSYEQEASLFVRLNDHRKPLKPLEKFWAAHDAGHPEAVDILRIVERSGFKLRTRNEGGKSSQGAISAISVLIKLFREYNPDALETVLQLIAEAFGTTQAPSAPVILALASFRKRYAGKYDEKRLQQTLQRMSLRKWEIDANEFRKHVGAASHEAAGYELVKAYNARLHKSHRLAPWLTAYSEPE